MGNPKLIRTVTDQNIDDWTLENWTSARYSQDDLIGTVLHTSVSNREAEQAMYLESPGGRWPYYGAKFTFQQLVDAFPLGSMHSQKPSDMTLLADLFRRYGVVQKDWEEVAQRTEQPADPLNVYERGVVGENLFHLLMLTRTGTPEGRDMVKYLVCLFGAQLVNMPYQLRNKNADPPGEYEGETALHIAIVGKDLEMVRFLVEHGASLKARAWGTFFGKSGNCYSGEYPLSFAVSVGNEETVRYLISVGSQVNRDCDMLGNYALHMAVWKKRPEMYDLLVKECGADEQARNFMGLTPLCLAAMQQDVAMYCYILQKQSFMLWMYGAVTCYGTPLDQVDSVQDDDRESPFSVINMVVLNNSKMDIVSNRSTLIFDMLLEKWNLFARKYFIYHLLFHIADMALFTMLVIFVRYGLPYGDDTAVLRTESYDIEPYMCVENVPFVNATGHQNPGYHVDFDHVGAYRCKAPKAVWMHDERFEFEWGVFLEVANILMVMLHFSLMLYDWYRTSEFMSNIVQLRTDQRSSDMHGHRVPPAHRIPTTVRIAGRQHGDAETNTYSKFAAKFTGWVSGDSQAKGGGSKRSRALLSKSTFSREPQRTIFDVVFRKGSPAMGTPAQDVRAWVVRVWTGVKDLKVVAELMDPSFYNVIFFCVPRAVHFFLWLSGSSPPDHNWELAVAALFEWTYLYYFCRGFRSLGHLVEMLRRMISKDVFFFVVLYAIICGGFSEALYLLVRKEFVNGDTQMNVGNYNTLIHTVITMVLTSLGDIHYQSIGWGDEEEHGYGMGLFVTQVVFMVWLLLSNIVMINLLIALMGNTFNTVNENSEREWMLQWARIILHTERRLPRSLKQHYRLGRPIKRVVAGVEDKPTYYHFWESVESTSDICDQGFSASQVKQSHSEFGESTDKLLLPLRDTFSSRKVKDAVVTEPIGHEPMDHSLEPPMSQHVADSQLPEAVNSAPALIPTFSQSDPHTPYPSEQGDPSDLSRNQTIIL